MKTFKPYNPDQPYLLPPAPRSSSNQKSMDVVRHQHVYAQSKTAAFPIVLQSLKIAQPISVIVKEFLALVAAHYDMIKRSTKAPARQSRNRISEYLPQRR